MHNKFLNITGGIFVFFAISCGSSNVSNEDMREASAVPERFSPPEGVMLGDNSCKSPLTDLRDGTTLLMIRSWGDGRGDYQVPDGKYSVRRGELLRINCNTGEVLGIVRR